MKFRGVLRLSPTEIWLPRCVCGWKRLSKLHECGRGRVPQARSGVAVRHEDSQDSEAGSRTVRGQDGVRTHGRARHLACGKPRDPRPGASHRTRSAPASAHAEVSCARETCPRLRALGHRGCHTSRCALPSAGQSARPAPGEQVLSVHRAVRFGHAPPLPPTSSWSWGGSPDPRSQVPSRVRPSWWPFLGTVALGAAGSCPAPCTPGAPHTQWPHAFGVLFEASTRVCKGGAQVLGTRGSSPERDRGAHPEVIKRVFGSCVTPVGMDLLMRM